MDQIDESDNFLLEEVDHDDFLEQHLLFQPLDDSAAVDEDMDTSSFIDLDEHVDSLVFDVNDIFFSDDEEFVDLDGSYDPLEDDLIDEIDQCQSETFDLDIKVEKVNVTQDLDPAYSYDFTETHLYMSQPPENQTSNKSEKRASLINAKHK